MTCKFKCKKCDCIVDECIEIRTDQKKKQTWEEEHKKRLVLRAEQEIILAEFKKIVSEHNSKQHWWNLLWFNKWHVCERPFKDFLDIVDFLNKEPIKSVKYDGTVMDRWMNYIHRKPSFEYIECPVCHCKNYIRGCKR